MATIRVKPNGNGWTVTKNRSTVSNHRKKTRAKQSAKRSASSGDQLIIQRANGTIQDQKRVR